MNPIESDATAAVSVRNGGAARGRDGSAGRRRPAARSRIEAAAAANAHAAQAVQAVGETLGELYANPLIARLDLEGIGGGLDDADLEAVLHLVRRLEVPVPLPQRQPGAGNGTGPQAAQRMP